VRFGIERVFDYGRIRLLSMGRASSELLVYVTRFHRSEQIGASPACMERPNGFRFREMISGSKASCGVSLTSMYRSEGSLYFA
jgi:hypothetical protein